jgi:UDP-N-acetyl-D-mannosaminuronate dehydrogenase
MQNNDDLDRIVTKMFKKCMEYGDFESETNDNYTKVCFLGLNLNPNKDGIWNFDILYLYRALQERGLQTRLHDPHIKPTVARSMGVWIGRHTERDNWSQGFDVMVLSCPHMYYLKNMTQLYQLFKPNKPCMVIDLFGVFSMLALMKGESHHVDIINFRDQYKKGELMGGLQALPRIQLPGDSDLGL